MKKWIRKILLSVCMAIFMVASIVGVVCTPSLSSTFARAAGTEAWQTGVFEMEDGVSLQFSKVGGMRFIVKMDEAVANFVKETDSAEMGFVIAPENLMLAANGDYLNMSKKIGGAIDKNKIYQDGDYYFANGCITGLKYANLERDFVAVAYIKSGSEVRYTEYNTLARNNIYDLVNMAVLNGYANEVFEGNENGYTPYVTVDENDEDGWYGTEEFPIVVENTTEYTAVVDAVNSGIDLSAYQAIVKNDATPSYGFTSTEMQPTIINHALYTVNSMIAGLPDSVAMPSAVHFVARIHEAERAYKALSTADQAQVENYAKVESLLSTIEGYDRVYKHDADDGTVIPSYVPNYTSTVGGTASIRQDSLYGNVLTVTSDASGKAALHFQNFPSIENYAKIYFYVKVSVGCDIYLSDGITNDGWGENGKNTWSTSGYWCNADGWRLVEIDPSSGYIGMDFALGFRTNTTGFSFEISDIYGAQNGIIKTVDHLFGAVTDSGEINEYGRVYNLSQDSIFTDTITLGYMPQNVLSNALPENFSEFYFWMYNPFAEERLFRLEGTIGDKGWIRAEAEVSLAPQAWTKVTIPSQDIEDNKNGQWFVYIENANEAGWKISPFYYGGEVGESVATDLSFANKTDSGTTNEYGKIYNISREQYYIDTNNNNTIGTLQANKLANALPQGGKTLYFWIYNPTDTAYTFHLAGSVSESNGNWKDSADFIALPAKAWTKIIISAADIELNKQGQWYVYILGGDGAGAAKDGWQISDIYSDKAPEEKVIVYIDHADVKNVIALINAIPETVTLADKEAVEKASAAYDALSSAQQALISNVEKLNNAKLVINDTTAAQEVIDLIDSINARDLDEALVNEARTKYNALSDTAKSMVTNLSTLEEYEAEIEAANTLQAQADHVTALINKLPDTVTMPTHVEYVALIVNARDAYNALSDEAKALVENYAKLRNAIKALKANNKGYEMIYTPDESGIKAIPAVVHAAAGTTVTGSLSEDETYGTIFTSTANAGGKAAIQFVNFPSVAGYEKIYFMVKASVGTQLYLSAGTTNDGWGENWKNNSATTGDYAITVNEWSLVSVDVSTDIITSDWVMSVWGGNNVNQTLSVGAIIAVKDITYEHLGTKTTITFGSLTDTGTTGDYGTIYTLKQEAWVKNDDKTTNDDTDIGALTQGVLRNGLPGTCDYIQFWIYNPNSSEVTLTLAGGTSDAWYTYPYALPSKQWTKVEITPEMITLNESYALYVSASEGASTDNWQISAIYAYDSQAVSEDAVLTVQDLIDALNTATVDEAKVTAARTAYEALSEAEKEFVDIEKLTTCETTLYGEVANAPFIVNGATQYKIYYDGDTLNEVASFVQEQLAQVTGAELSLVRTMPSSNLTKYRYAIVFGNEEVAESLGWTVPTKDVIGTTGYAIKRIGRTVVIMAYGNDGYRMGALAFLREVLGYDMISEDCVIYSKDGASLPALDLTEKPAFDYRQQQTYMTSDEVLGMGLQSHTDLWIPSPDVGNGAWDMHNTLYYIPQATYGSAHPSWYYTKKDSGNTSRTQICPTAGGSSTEFNAMVDAIAASMLVQINAYPDRENICLSTMDSAGGDYCTCTRCTLYNTLYGDGGFTAAWIDLMNAVNAKIRESLPEDRTLNIAFLAYRDTETAPINSDGSLKQRYVIADDGSYSLQKDASGNPVYLKCDEGVMPWVAPIGGKFAENFNHADNAATLQTITNWTKLADDVYLWMYGTNFKYYMLPYNTWQASAENYKILAELGVKGAWSQSNETEATAFSDLKGYIDSKFMLNVNADYDTVLNTYFNNYFGAGATQMRSMFDKIVAKCEEIEANYDGLGRGIYDNIENTEGKYFWSSDVIYWSESWCNELIALCDEAKAAVDADPTLSELEKTAIKNRITKESLFPRYVLCTFFGETSMRAAFKADCTALNVTLYKEGGEISSLCSSW